jgi:pilus assembly protein Flp/PilA
MNAISAYLTTLAFYAGQRLGKATKGATAVEYGLLVALIAAVIILVVTTLGNRIQGVFQSVVNAMPAAPAA